MANSPNLSSNVLAKEQSAYLRQHASNPVHWVPWAEDHFTSAKENDRLIIISIGYAACHWCHVMEHESFEDEIVAQLMNDNFVSIKVDREERPDVDHVYMQALQLLTGQGGWPLNIVALPDGRPVWGGTYFPKDQWMHYLQQIVQLQKENPEKLLAYASQLNEGMQQLELEKHKDQQAVTANDLAKAVNDIYQKLDLINGGMQGAPKFMMPTLLELFTASDNYTEHLRLSLDKMALGGLFDVLRGGFSRYSVDERWHIPHFEKMGYDNGQLLYIYSEAFLTQASPLYKEVVEKTVDFLQEDLHNGTGGYYASLDADSFNKNGQLEEGAFYVWTKNELEELALLQQPHFSSYYGINQDGLWEKDNYVFFRKQALEDYKYKHELNDNFNTQVALWETRLLEARNKRSKPRLDDKIICSWNALIGSGLLRAYRAFGNEDYARLAKNNLDYIFKHLHSSQGGLYRLNKKEAPVVHGFLEDYSALIRFYLDAYECFFDPIYLTHVRHLIDYCFTHFLDSQSPLFVFSAKEKLVVETREINDNVIPSSNAMMAENLLRASVHIGKPEWSEHAQKMLATVAEEMYNYPRAYSYWLRTALNEQKKQREIVIVGPKALDWIREIQQQPLKNTRWAASTVASNLPLLQNRFKANITQVYICENNQCGLPLRSVEEAKIALGLT